MIYGHFRPFAQTYTPISANIKYVNQPSYHNLSNKIAHHSIHFVFIQAAAISDTKCNKNPPQSIIQMQLHKLNNLQNILVWQMFFILW